MTQLLDTTPAIIVCSANRPEMLHDSLLSLVRQSVRSHIFVSVPDLSHVLEDTKRLPNVSIVVGRLGLTSQRNAALRSIRHQPQVIFFFDDDVECEEHYVEEMLSAFHQHPEAVIVGGTNLAQGIYSAGVLDRKLAQQLIEEHTPPVKRYPFLQRARAICGYNMAVRGDVLGKVEFDEALPLYGFLEDQDFALRCCTLSSMLKNPNAIMVHIETAQGRIGGMARGYSEVVNPFYIAANNPGMPPRLAYLGSISRTLRSLRLALTGKGFSRFVGNLKGWLDVASGEPDPSKILTMKT